MKKNKIFIPKVGEKFYYLNHTWQNKLYVQDIFFNGCDYDLTIIKHNRIWQYKKEATIALRKIKQILKGG